MTASPPARSIGSGSVVAGRYEILAALGTGGMATVFKAHDRALDVGVALKVLKASPSRDPELAQRFRSEIKLAWRVRHRNVCGIHEYGEDGDLLYISMELVEGKDLKHLLRDAGPLSWEQAYDVAIQIAEGLEAIHEAGVIHRDLKPANITRDARGLVRLMDFGIAKVWGEDSGGATRTGHVVGSPEYMSPEQVRGASVDFRSDIYALGLVIYELFTGRVPFGGDTPAAAMMRRLDEDPDWEGPAARQIPAAALLILRKALAREPAKRYPSCGEILAELRAARSGLSRQTTDEMGQPDEPETATGPARPPTGPPVPIFSREAQARLLVPPLARAVKHANCSVRLGAVEALGRLGGDGLLALPVSRLATEALEAAQRDEDERVRVAAAVSLDRLEPPAPAPVLIPKPRAPTPIPEQLATDTHAPSVPELGLPASRRWTVVLLVAALAVLALVFAWSALRTPRVTLPTPSPPASLTTVESTLPLVASAQPIASPSPTPPEPTGPPPSTWVAGTPRPRVTLAARPRPTSSPELATAEPTPSPQPTPSVEPESTPRPAAASLLPETPTTIVTQPPAPVTPATCLSCPVPEAAQVLRARLGLPRSVRLGIQISARGDVLRVDYLVGPAPLRDTITKAALRWRYRPARRGETPVPSFVKVDIELP